MMSDDSVKVNKTGDVELRLHFAPRWVNIAAYIGEVATGGGFLWVSHTCIQARYKGGRWRRITRWMEKFAVTAMFDRYPDDVDRIGVKAWVATVQGKALRADYEARNGPSRSSRQP